VRDAAIAVPLSAWFARHARALPWREEPRDPYGALVSEVMLQQTQVSRVVAKYGEFMGRFPTVAALASAGEEEVLALWAGMGYYRRARNLHACAREIVLRFGGEVPRRVEALRSLPGVGRYTAGAVASMVFGAREATVDGNIARVLLRVEGKELDAEEGVKWAWGRAEKMVRTAEAAGVGAGVLNEALMELGAVVCVPRGARCGVCPLGEGGAGVCRASRAGKQERIPRAKVRSARKVVYCAAVLLEDDAGRVLVERRGDGGMWAGLWQVVTVEGDEGELDAAAVRRGLGLGARAVVERVGGFEHATTHRDVRFTVWRGRARGDGAARIGDRRPGAVWLTWAGLDGLGMSSTQRRVVAMVGEGAGAAGDPAGR
jgi:A/G-specific adenine glycosylase